MPPNRELGQRLREVRILLALSQAELATQLMISRDHLAKIECGNNVPSRRLLAEYSRVCNVPMEYLLHGTGAPLSIKRAAPAATPPEPAPEEPPSRQVADHHAPYHAGTDAVTDPVAVAVDTTMTALANDESRQAIERAAALVGLTSRELLISMARGKISRGEV